jgi:hypothetical protein
VGNPGEPGHKGHNGTRGPKGRDALVTCKVKDNRKNAKKPEITCTVSFHASSSTVRASVSIWRANRTLARGHSRVRHGRVRVPLRGSLRPGRYRITVLLTDAGGATTASSSLIRVR